jgi:hypothetical protein
LKQGGEVERVLIPLWGIKKHKEKRNGDEGVILVEGYV